MAVRAVGSSREPEEWRAASERARVVRSNVAQQVSELIVMADMTGSFDLVRDRVAQVGQARATGDPDVLRAAAMECSVAFGLLAVELDLAR